MKNKSIFNEMQDVEDYVLALTTTMPKKQWSKEEIVLWIGTIRNLDSKRLALIVSFAGFHHDNGYEEGFRDGEEDDHK